MGALLTVSVFGSAFLTDIVIKRGSPCIVEGNVHEVDYLQVWRYGDVGVKDRYTGGDPPCDMDNVSSVRR